MPLTINCPACQKPVSVPETYGGKRVQCPRCQEQFTAPGKPVIVAEVAPEEEEPRRHPRRDDRDDRDRDDRPRRRAFADDPDRDDDEDSRRDRRRRRKEEWHWSWNPLVGIMYGPVPVGLLAVGGMALLALVFGALGRR